MGLCLRDGSCGMRDTVVHAMTVKSYAIKVKISPETPIIILCLDNTSFRGVMEDGSMLPISQSVKEDNVQGTMFKAPLWLPLNGRCNMPWTTCRG